MQTLRVVDHTRTPGGRFRKDGPYSGEWFRDDILEPMLRRVAQSGGQLVVELDGPAGYGSSFLEETFGGLARKADVIRAGLLRHLTVTAATALYRPYEVLAQRYLAHAVSVMAPAA